MAGHRGRQRGVVGGRRIVHKVKVTAEQERRLQRLAAAQGVTVARLLVEATLTRDGWSPGQQRVLGGELMRATTALGRVGNNLNQLTAYTHADRRLARGLVELLVEVERVVERVDAAAANLKAAS